MKFNWKSLFVKKHISTEKSSIDNDEIELNKHVYFYYTNIINSLILFTYNSKKLEDMAPILIDPLTELYEELEYAFTPVCFETVFRIGLIDNTYKSELLDFKNEIDDIPSEIWHYEFIDNHNTWKKIREKSNCLLDKLGVTSLAYNSDFSKIYYCDRINHHKGKKDCKK